MQKTPLTCSFNSNMVRLRPGSRYIEQILSHLFQFHYGAIKTMLASIA